ncbi:hypothetical protein HEK616_35190 [Streptomyces nigrescens]|uniref:Uncharacterized protein n=1 Tax=Streptomyces nigrescens TaxID=1920 RepID=A0ABM7ZUI4_STRNI|nr:hypothetical protein HEK616_35190 [Streptomyces nigrescens]
MISDHDVESTSISHAESGKSTNVSMRQEIQTTGSPQLVQRHLVQPLPHSGVVPVPQPPPASHPRAEPELTGQPLPLDAGVEDEQDAAQHLAVLQCLLPPRPPLTIGGGDGSYGSITRVDLSVARHSPHRVE